MPVPPSQRSFSFAENKLLVFCLGILITIILACVFLPFFWEYSYRQQNLEIGAIGPTKEYIFGTDTLGRDLAARIFYGGKISLLVGMVGTIISVTIGVAYGMVSGFFGGWIDRIMMRIIDILYTIPLTIFVILLMVVFGQNLLLIFISIGAVEWLTLARIVRGQVLILKEQTFVEASQSIGQNKFSIMTKHLFPNLRGVILVYTTLTIPSVILLESFISFLGLGVKAPQSSWGVLINEGAASMESYPWMLIFPCLFLFITLWSLNFIGDRLRDLYDPTEER